MFKLYQCQSEDLVLFFLNLFPDVNFLLFDFKLPISQCPVKVYSSGNQFILCGFYFLLLKS